MRMVPIYKHFSKGLDNQNYDDSMLLQMYQYESTGKGQCDANNGYYLGKKYLNLAVSMWKEDLLKGTLFLFELYEDTGLPNWWLDKVFKGYYDDIDNILIPLAAWAQ